MKTTITGPETNYGFEWECISTTTHKAGKESFNRVNSITPAAEDIIGKMRQTQINSTPYGEFDFEVLLTWVNYTLEWYRSHNSQDLPWVKVMYVDNCEAIVFDGYRNTCMTLEEWQYVI